MPCMTRQNFDKIFLREESTIAPFIATAAVDTSMDLMVQFTGPSPGGVSPFETNYVWGFGDGGSSSEQNPTHVYSEPGTYTITHSGGVR